MWNVLLWVAVFHGSSFANGEPIVPENTLILVQFWSRVGDLHKVQEYGIYVAQFSQSNVQAL